MERIFCSIAFIRLAISPFALLWMLNWVATHLFVWCSLNQARKLLQKGLAWKIGDSETIGIDSHKWLPNPPSFKPGADRILKVSALFNPDIRIKLGHSRSRDKLMWMETKSRTFSVKTAYQVALRLHRFVTGKNSLVSQDKQLWNKIWALNTPSKVRNFIWRACSDVFPTRVNLLRRKVHINPLCSLCGQHDETTSHILWECPFAHNTWALVWGNIQKSNSEAPCFYPLARQMLDRLPKKELETWAMTA